MKPIKNVIITAFSAILLITLIAYGVTLIFHTSEVTFVTTREVTAMGQNLTIIKYDFVGYINQLENLMSYSWEIIKQKFNITELNNQLYLSALGGKETDVAKIMAWLLTFLPRLANLFAFIYNMLLLVSHIFYIILLEYPLALIGLNITTGNWWLANVLNWCKYNLWIPYIYF